MEIIYIIIGLVVGALGGILYSRKATNSKANFIIKDAKQNAENIIQNANVQAESIKKERIVQAKEKFLELKTEHDANIQAREKKMQEIEKRAKDKESKLNDELSKVSRLEKDLEKQQIEYQRKSEIVDKKQAELNEAISQKVEMLEKISNYSADEAKKELVESLKAEAKTRAQAYVQNIMEEAQMNAKNEARKIVIQTIQRIGTEQAIENSVSVFNIESDEVKGRIIGKSALMDLNTFRGRFPGDINDTTSPIYQSDLDLFTDDIKLENGTGVTNLEGLQYFRKLKEVIIEATTATSLDLTGLEKLERIEISGTSLQILSGSGVNLKRVTLTNALSMKKLNLHNFQNIEQVLIVEDSNQPDHIECIAVPASKVNAIKNGINMTGNNGPAKTTAYRSKVQSTPCN